MHIDAEELELHALNRLSGVAADVVREHLIDCEQCRLELAEIELYIKNLRQVLRGTDSPHKPTT